ncbi:MAG TPA: YscO family type III secretion system apparatus protein [Actinomycetota bacterium]|nr:YscO family type III secretion system apparatus protein [Actinomycetota bacterium]
MDRLLELQDLDTRVARLEQRRAQLDSGEDLAAARRAMEESESVLGELRLALDDVDRTSRRLEQEIESFSAKSAAEEKRMYDGSIVNTKELEALQHEIASLRERRSRAEDQLLELMERREDLDARATAASGQVETAREHADRVGGDASRELDDIASTLARLTAERAELVPSLDEELLDLYEDLRRQKHGVGAAALVDGVCQACHEKLSAVELDKLKRSDGIRRCEYCRRILIFA